MKYLLDTNICIFWLRKQQTIVEKILNIGLANCCISEITFAELLFGEELAIMKGGNKYKKQPLQEFLSKVSIIPIKPAIELYAKEKARLQCAGTHITDDFDLLIACTSITNNLILITDNTKQFKNVTGIQLENWMVR